MAVFRELPSILCCIHHNTVLLHLGMCSSVCKVHRLQIYAYIVCTNVLWKSNIKIYRRVETSRCRITNRHAVLKVCLFSNGHTIWEGFRIQMGLSEFTSLLVSAKICYLLLHVLWTLIIDKWQCNSRPFAATQLALVCSDFTCCTVCPRSGEDRLCSAVEHNSHFVFHELLLCSGRLITVNWWQ